MAVDPTPREKIPSRPASSRPAGLTFRPIGPNQVDGYSNRHCKEEYWVFDQKSVDQEAGLTFSYHVLMLRVEAKQLKYMRASHALAQVLTSKAL